ncbi:MAG: DNA-binding protein [Candidatus Omnitrophota bacterium]|nr:DNA-binding protein [Candidatus Omnitrophota bacterium]
MRVKGYGFIVFYVISLSLIPYPSCFAEPISSKELIENAKQYDGKVVEYEGEAVGEVMRRGDYGWVNVNDGENAIGVWAARDFLNMINFSGSYAATGDWLKVKGGFNRACLIHGGDLDIHAEEIVKIKSGELKERAWPKYKQNLVIYLAGVLLCLWLILIMSRKKPSRK